MKIVVDIEDGWEYKFTSSKHWKSKLEDCTMSQGTYKPKGKFKKDLELAELDYDTFTCAIQFFKERAIDFNYVPGRGFRFWKWAPNNQPSMIILWCGPGAVREYLDAPSTVGESLNRLAGETQKA